MLPDPLAPPPPDSAVLRTFQSSFGLQTQDEPVKVLEQLGLAFFHLPFENLTKIIKEAQAGRREEARRGPAEVIADHLKFGTGGTCFSLTAALLHLVRAMGFQAEPILADRSYGADTHSGLLVWIDSQPHLLDPGYLLTRPIPLHRSGELRLTTPFNEVILNAKDEGTKIELFTIQQGEKKYRLTFKTDPADRSHFLRTWDASFDADMMNYPVLSLLSPGGQKYLQKNQFITRDSQFVERTQLSSEQMIGKVAKEFGIAGEVTAQALAILKRKGRWRG
jgi:arylamine N-acetyltransferase